MSKSKKQDGQTTINDNVYTMNLGKTKQVKQVFKQKVDTSTGEIFDQEIVKEFTTEVKTDEFFMCFFKNFAPFYGLKHIADIKLIACMCELAEFNTGIVQMTPKVRQTISNKTGISISNMSRNLKRLAAVRLLVEDKGEYTINPAVFWKGKIQQRTDVLRSEGGLRFSVTIVEEVKEDLSKHTDKRWSK